MHVNNQKRGRYDIEQIISNGSVFDHFMQRDCLSVGVDHKNDWKPVRVLTKTF